MESRVRAGWGGRYVSEETFVMRAFGSAGELRQSV